MCLVAVNAFLLRLRGHVFWPPSRRVRTPPWVGPAAVTLVTLPGHNPPDQPTRGPHEVGSEAPQSGTRRTVRLLTSGLADVAAQTELATQNEQPQRPQDEYRT